jgi:hypothetical protein
MSFAAIVWIACLAIAVMVFIAVRSTLRSLFIASAVSFIVAYAAVVFVGHPVAGVSFSSLAVSSFASAVVVAIIRMALIRSRAHRNA